MYYIYHHKAQKIMNIRNMIRSNNLKKSARDIHIATINVALNTSKKKR